ncbi:MAG: transporter substrate-binding domain-containing protein [Clostridia bacterium]|nr:transporter substrate-binding domain-containing protein [Clostridia bacterium]
MEKSTKALALILVFTVLSTNAFAATIYAPDGRSAWVDDWAVSSYEAVGWYSYPVVSMYAPDGRCIVVADYDVSRWESVGWYDGRKTTTIYAPDGRTATIPLWQLQSYLSVGWYDYPSFNGFYESDFDYIKSKGKMVIGITEFLPMNFKDGSGEWTGFETDFATAVCEKLGVAIEFAEIDWDNKQNELNSKSIDCIWNAMCITDERKESMSISIPYMGNKQVLITKKEDVKKYLNGVDGARVVAEKGSGGEDLINGDAFFANAEFIPVNSQSTALLKVKSGTADIAVVDYVLTIGFLVECTDFKNLAIVETEDFEPEEYGIAFRKGSDVTEKVNATINELAKDGTLQRIAEKYKLEEMLLVK